MRSTKGAIFLFVFSSILSVPISYAYGGVMEDILKSLAGGLSITGKHVAPPPKESRSDLTPQDPVPAIIPSLPFQIL